MLNIQYTIFIEIVFQLLLGEVKRVWPAAHTRAGEQKTWTHKNRYSNAWDRHHIKKGQTLAMYVQCA